MLSGVAEFTFQCIADFAAAAAAAASAVARSHSSLSLSSARPGSNGGGGSSRRRQLAGLPSREREGNDPESSVHSLLAALSLSLFAEYSGE